MLRFARTMKKVSGRKWEKFLPDAPEFRKNECECDEHVGAEGVWSQIEVEVTCVRNETATIYSGRRKALFPRDAPHVGAMREDVPKGIPRECERG